MIGAPLAVLLLATAATCGAPPADTGPGLDLTRVAVVGDSMSTGYGADRGWHELVDAELHPDGQLEAWAVNGATSLRWLEEYPELLDTLADHDATLVIVMLGGNDYLIGRPPTVWADHTRRLAERITELAPTADLMLVRYYDLCGHGLDCDTTLTWCDMTGACDGHHRQDWGDYGRAMRDLADTVGATYVDVATPGPDTGMLDEDRAHLNADGHRWLADQVLAELR